MTYPSAAIANFFLNRAKAEGRSLDPMQLQKLVYFAHGWQLGLTGLPLISENVEAWEYGPVVPELYRELKRYGAGPVTRPITEYEAATGRIVEAMVSDARTERLLQKVWDVYGHLSALQLSEMTHRAGTPWTEARRRSPGARSVVIPEQSMRDYFATLAQHNAGQPGHNPGTA